MLLISGQRVRVRRVAATAPETSTGRSGRIRRATGETSMAETETPQGAAITREEGSSKGRYVMRVEGREAEMTYSRAGEASLIIDHTGVPEALRGRGLGEALVRRGVEDARAEGRSIMPLCPFAKAQFDRHPEWQDVLKR
jgi:predicted GNAT family acetyltransferase